MCIKNMLINIYKPIFRFHKIYKCNFVNFIKKVKKNTPKIVVYLLLYQNLSTFNKLILVKNLFLIY